MINTTVNSNHSSTYAEQDNARPPAKQSYFSLGRTPGEKLFNIIDYYGIGLFANTALSSWLTDAAEHTWLKPIQNNLAEKWVNAYPFKKQGITYSHQDLKKSGGFLNALQSHFPAIHRQNADNLEKFSEKIGTPNQTILDALNDAGHLLEHEEGLEKAFEKTMAMTKKFSKARWGVNFGLLFSGGWILLLPIKWLEDAKIPLTQHFDRILGKEHPSEEEQQKLDAAYKDIEQEPRQSWASEILARLSVMPVIMGLYFKTGFQNNWIRKLGGSFKEFEGTKKLAIGTLGPKIGEGITEALGPAGKSLERSLAVAPAGWREAYIKDADPSKRELAELFPPISGKERFGILTGIVILEFLYAIPNATLLFINAHIFSRLLNYLGFNENKKPSHTQEAAVALPTTTAPTHMPKPTPPSNTPDTKITHAEKEASIPSRRASNGKSFAVSASHIERLNQSSATVADQISA